jgi:energy-coupling factor transport system ATP-binding protein
MKIAISTSELIYRYPTGQEALRGVSISIQEGKVVSIIGKNGAGKTTLAKHLNGLLKPTSGSVVVQGEEVSGKSTSEMAHHVGYVFQNPEDQLFESSVFEEVAFGPKNLGVSREQIDQEVRAALSMVGLLPVISEHPYNLTYGQRKMLCIASVLAMRPEIVILDEPNAGQDYFGLKLLGKILEKLRSEKKTVLMISHDIEFVAEHSDESVLMHDGRVIVHASTRSVLSDMANLSSSAVRPPQVTRLAFNLTRIGMKRDIITVREMVESIEKSLRPET